jgi:hypothetical protein
MRCRFKGREGGEQDLEAQWQPPMPQVGSAVSRRALRDNESRS